MATREPGLDTPHEPAIWLAALVAASSNADSNTLLTPNPTRRASKGQLKLRSCGWWCEEFKSITACIVERDFA